MYLVLLDYNYISSEEFQELIEQYDADADIVHSSSSDTLLNIAEKLLPEIIIIDFSMVKDEGAAYFEALSEASNDAYVLVLLDPEYYERLNMVIESGGIDGYIAKPIRKEEFLARIQIAYRQKHLGVEEGPVNQAEYVEQTEPIEGEELPGDAPDRPDKPEDDRDHSIKEHVTTERFAPSDIDQTEPLPLVEEQLPVSEENIFEEEITDEKQIQTDLSDDISDGRIINDLSSGITEEYFETLNLSSKQENNETPDSIKEAENTVLNAETETKPETSGSLFDDVIFEDQPEPVKAEVKPADDQGRTENGFNLEDKIRTDQYEKLQRDIDEAVVKPAMEFLNQAADVTIQSSLPGKSADEFLYGESQITAESDIIPITNEFNKTDQFNEESEFNKAAVFTTEEEFTGIEDFETIDNGISRTRSRSKKRRTGSSGPLKLLTALGNIIFILVLLFMALVSFFLILDRTADTVPEVAGYQLYIIKSETMSPELVSGSLAYGREVTPEQISVGDVIAFRSLSDPDLTSASRVISIDREDRVLLSTRGDANTLNDPSPTLADDVIGRVTGSFPYLGSLLDFAKTSEGLILLIFVPGALIIILQLYKIVFFYSGKKKM